MNAQSLQESINKARVQALMDPQSSINWFELAQVIDTLNPDKSKSKEYDTSSHAISSQESLVDSTAVTPSQDLATINKQIEDCLDKHRACDFSGLEVSVAQLELTAPANPWTLALLGVSHTQKKQYIKSKSYLEQAVQIEPSNPWFRIWLCENAIHSRDIDTLLQYGQGILMDESNKRGSFISLMASALRISREISHVFPESLSNLHAELLLDLAKSDDASMQALYKLFIQSIDSFLCGFVEPSNMHADMLLQLHDLRSKSAKIMH